MMGSRAAKLLVVIALGGGCASGVPADQLACGQKVLVENNTCPADQILEVTGSCLKTAPEIDVVRTPRGTQYNCVKRKRE